MLAVLLDGRVLPSADHRRWRAGPSRWLDVERALSGAVEQAPTSSLGAHPDTVARAVRYTCTGLVLGALVEEMTAGFGSGPGRRDAGSGPGADEGPVR